MIGRHDPWKKPSKISLGMTSPSILAHRHAIYFFILSGWLLVAITFLLSWSFSNLQQVSAFDHKHCHYFFKSI
ncbi:hypothetical protein Scep_022711 [Stephania cephalantha]|uniref:Uncharacterized protein n=1 Tax=Stephania cephalantha TaxID=152367 RepID=A0AAP0I155_9MAGN